MKSQRNMKKYIILLFFPVLLFSCKGGDKADISNINLTIDLMRLDKDLFNISPDTTEIKKNLPTLREKYGSFFELYSQNIIHHIGNSSSETYPAYLQSFLMDKSVQAGWQKSKEVFADDTEMIKNITIAFKHFKYYFPDKMIPKVYTYISGFGESMALADSLVGISIDKYLGADYEGYDMLSFSKYLSRKMYKEKIPSDCVKAWGIGEFPFTDDGGNNLISKMIYEGKLLYFTKMMIPNEADTIIFGFTKNELKWCKENEKNMWAFLIEEKLLFSTDHLTIVKMTEEAPFTSLFPPESPGRACNWIGYQIVKRYMERNKDVTLAQLMEDNKHIRIYEKTRYKP